MKVVIMAGGRGTRITSVASDIPKPMIKIGDKPVLEHELECLKSQGFTDIIITFIYKPPFFHHSTYNLQLRNKLLVYRHFQNGREYIVNRS